MSKAKKKSKPISPKDNSANMPNANKGTIGTNRQHDQNQGNRGRQLACNQQQTMDAATTEKKISAPKKAPKPINPRDNSANMPNANKGNLGTNRQHDQVHGNRSKQLNPNQNQ